jgi:hypothetical protein
MMPVLIALSDHLVVRLLVFVFSLLFFLAATLDWIGYQSPLPYQLILKVLHTPLAALGAFFAWRWLRTPQRN